MDTLRPRRRPLITLLVAIAALACSAAPVSAAEVGVATDTTWGLSTSDMDKTVAMEKAAGIRWVRESASWTAMERDGKGQLNTNFIANIDAAIAKDVAAGFEVMMYIDQVPYWASGDPNKYIDSNGVKHWNKYYRPANMQDYADFVSWAVGHYSALGVRSFQIWNEPNHTHFWPSGPNASEYVGMLRAGYNAAKQANPSAVVVMAGLSPDGTAPLYDFLTQMYAAGARSYMDRVAVHQYPSDDPTRCWTDSSGRYSVKALCGLREVEKITAAAGDADKPIWITEIGYSTCGEVSSTCWGFTEAQQADYLPKAYAKLAADHPSVEVAFWYQFRNLYWQNDPTTWNGNMGLVHQDFTPKPAYDALKAYTSALAAEPAPEPAPEPEPEPPPADTQAPTAPGSLTATAGDARVDSAWTAASDAVGVSFYRVYRRTLDVAWPSTPVATVAGTSYSDTQVANGTAYEYRVTAVDAAGNESAPSNTATAMPVGSVFVPPLGVSLASPLAGDTFTRSISMAADATGHVARVEFLFDGRRVATDDAAPYAASYTVSKKTSYGTHTVTAVAFDTAGARVEHSAEVTRVRKQRTRASSRRMARSKRCRTQRAGRARGGRAVRKRSTDARAKRARGARTRTDRTAANRTRSGRKRSAGKRSRAVKCKRSRTRRAQRLAAERRSNPSRGTRAR